MCTAKHQGVNIALLQNAQIPGSDLICHRIMKPPFLHQRNKQRTGFAEHLNARLHLFHDLRVNTAADGRFRSNDTDTAVSGRFHSRLCPGMDHTNDRNIRLCRHSIQSQSRCRVAGNDNGLHLSGPQETDNLAGITQDRIPGFTSVGDPCGISKINDPLIRQLPHDLSCYRQAAHTGIEYANRRVSVTHGFLPLKGQVNEAVYQLRL